MTTESIPSNAAPTQKRFLNPLLWALILPLMLLVLALITDADHATPLVMLLVPSSLIIAAVAWHMHKHIMSPLHQLTKAIRLLDEGNTDAFHTAISNCTSKNRHFNELMQSLDDITQKWLKSEQDMQSRIEERTVFLVEMQEQFRRIVDNVPGIVFHLAEENTGRRYFTFVSDQISGIFGVTPQDVYLNADTVLHTIHKHDLAELEKTLADSRASHLPSAVDFRVLVKGHEFWLRMNIMPSLSDGNITEWDGIITDISRQKSYERELKDYRDNLEARVEEQTRDIINAKEQAEHANMAKTQFLSNVSHELRTPMHAILSFSALGAERAEKLPVQKMIEYFNDINLSGKRLLSLVDDLLDLTKLESHNVSLMLAAHNMEDLINQACHQVQPLAQQKFLHLNVIITESHSVVECDYNRVTQVMVNLLSNAIKYAPPNSTITILGTLTSLPAPVPGKEVPAFSVSVSDEGPGIPEEEMDKLFKKFIQTSTAKITPGGTGLGLAICREIMELHHGTIHAKNNPDKGITFAFTLPYTQQTITSLSAA